MNSDRICLVALITLVPVLVWAGESNAPERLVWDKVPLTVTVPVGAERILTFPGETVFHFPAAELAKTRLQSVGSHAYVLAREPYGPVRVIAEVDTGDVILIDVEAVKGGSTNELIIQTEASAEQASGEEESSPGAKTKVSTIDIYEKMSRFAAHAVYAPTRLIKKPEWMSRVPVRQDGIAIYEGSELSMQPLAQWKRTKPPMLYVTAVLAKNRMGYGVDIDPRQLKGDFLAASPQHGRVLAKGSADQADTTVIYIVTRSPFDETVNAWVAEIH